ncbi:alpha/beta fold hydrolase [Adhaeribacter radiodurans]|uniref:Alpha/beta hydrolase n=1 Tax=Adhaeribacter radiodurans TaxID=2745197 RepID=A0A7L7LBT4_9BACT|nr:alpha/beta hydrolase [Adhaeribacter radiodurans]QMU30164.1 alpha/beta hydrolase [Adhaeribacter radiodurans]
MKEIDLQTVSDSGGSDKVLVFLHGFCESKEVWETFVQPFRESYRVIAIDLPGFGKNTAPRLSYSMEEAAAYVHKVLKNLEIKKCLLVGHSMGGYVALAFAEKHNNMVNGLCLFHSSALPDSKEKKATRTKTIKFIKKNGLSVFMDAFTAPLFSPVNRKYFAKEIKMLTAIGKETLPEAVIGAIKGMRDRKKRTKVLKDARYPVLFIAGKDDQAVTLEQTLAQCYLPAHSTVVFLAKTAHQGMFEKPVETRNALRSFAEGIL